MPFKEVEYKGKKLIFDEDGFLQNPEVWDEDVAEYIAKTAEGIEKMTEEHWKVVKFLREYYEKYGIAPPIRVLCKRTGFSLSKIYELFPSGPANGACKLAGLPKPTGCV